MTQETCTHCNGYKRETSICDKSGARQVIVCHICDGTGIKVRVYFANVLIKRDVGGPFMHPTLYDSLAEAQRYHNREFVMLKTIEVRI